MRILIAEDDLVSRNILTALLTHFGHDVVAAVDGQQALEAMQQPDSPRLAIMDWVMPRMDGVDVCRHIRKITNANPPYIILLTGKDDEKSIVEGLDAGANDYLTKPYRNEELRARVGVGQRMLELQADLIRAKDALAHEAMHDALTGAQNRRAILQALAFEMSRAKRQNSSLSIGMCDIDHFKKVNDQYGHLVGDDVLKGFVKIMFLVISPQSSGMPHQPLYERLRKAIAETDIQTSAGGVPITVSIGVALATGAEEMDTLLASADAALYRAKREGRNRVAYAGPDDAMEKTE